MSTCKFRKKPFEIEAMQWDGTRDSAIDIKVWADELAGCRIINFAGSNDCCAFAIETLEGLMHASPGDWVIRGVAGEFYPCKPEIFAATYEAVSDDH